MSTEYRDCLNLYSCAPVDPKLRPETETVVYDGDHEQVLARLIQNDGDVLLQYCYITCRENRHECLLWL